MAYNAWSVVAFEQPSAAKWNILGANDAGFADGTNIADDAIIRRHILADAIGLAELDWDAGIWWEELARTTLGATTDNLSVSFTTKKWLMVLLKLYANGGNINARMQVNGDTGSNYASRLSTNFGADATTTSQNLISMIQTASTEPTTIAMLISNDAAQEKQFFIDVHRTGGSGAGNAPQMRKLYSKWANTANGITSININNNDTGDYGVGSQIIVLGHD